MLMWFTYACIALVLLAARRTTEKRVASNISSSALAWLQQAMAIPFIVATLFFAPFFWPNQLPLEFWRYMAIYVVCASIDLYCYFKALSLADVSYVAPLMSLVAVANITGAYFVLGQKPSWHGAVGAALLITGAYIVNRSKRINGKHTRGNALALVYVLILVATRGYYANIEVFMLRMSNPTTFNFYSSILVIPLILGISTLAIRRRKKIYKDYWPKLRSGVRSHVWPLVFIGVTYTINLLCTYQAKLLSPNAGYVGAIKSASVLPVVLIGVFFLGEKTSRALWAGIGFILSGLVFLAMN